MGYYDLNVINDDILQINLYQINVRITRCFSQGKAIKLCWDYLENEGFPLEAISSTLVALEGIPYPQRGDTNILALPMHIIRMVDAINICESISGFRRRKDDLRDRLSTIIRNNRHLEVPIMDNGSLDYRKYWDYCDDLLKTMLSSTDEFRIANMLRELDSSLELTNVKGKKYPDFKIRDYNAAMTETFSLAELKDRLNRSYVGEEIERVLHTGKIINVTERDVVRLLCRDAFAKLEDSFNEQKAQITIVNLSHSDYGDIFAAYSVSSGKRYQLKQVLEKAKQMANERKQPVILFTEVFTDRPEDTTGVAAIVLEREIVEDLGKRLDKIDNDFYHLNHRRLDYFELIDRARHMIMDN